MCRLGLLLALIVICSFAESTIGIRVRDSLTLLACLRESISSDMSPEEMGVFIRFVNI